MFYRSLLLPDLRESLEANDRASLHEFCEALHAAVLAEILDELTGEEIWQVLSATGPERQAEIFSFLDKARQVSVVPVVPHRDLSRLIEEMPADERVDFLEQLDDDEVERILPLIAQAERADIRKLLSYPEGSAGSIMTTEYAWLPENITVDEAFGRLHEQAPDSETIYYIYIVDDSRRLDGMVTLRQLIQSRRSAKLADVMRHDVISVRVDDDVEHVAAEVARYDFLAIPVVDNQNRLVGIVTHDDAIDIFRKEAEEDALMQAGVVPLEDDYLATPVAVLVRKRVVWLAFLMGAAFVTARILEGYQQVAGVLTWMGWFQPLVLASGGNAGSQSATLIIRELALNESRQAHRMMLFWREVRVAALQGLLMMAIAFGGSAMLVDLQSAFVVSITVFLVVMMGTSTGAALPMLFSKLGMDPALMSNPLIAALSDTLGVIIYFTVAITLIGVAVPAV